VGKDVVPTNAISDAALCTTQTGIYNMHLNMTEILSRYPTLNSCSSSDTFSLSFTFDVTSDPMNQPNGGSCGQTNINNTNPISLTVVTKAATSTTTSASSTSTHKSTTTKSASSTTSTHKSTTTAKHTSTTSHSTSTHSTTSAKRNVEESLAVPSDCSRITFLAPLLLLLLLLQL